MVVKDTTQTLEEPRRCREQEHKEGKQGVRWLSRIRPRPWGNHGDVGNRNTRRGSRGLGGCQGYDPDPGGTTEM